MRTHAKSVPKSAKRCYQLDRHRPQIAFPKKLGDKWKTMKGDKWRETRRQRQPRAGQNGDHAGRQMKGDKAAAAAKSSPEWRSGRETNEGRQGGSGITTIWRLWGSATQSLRSKNPYSFQLSGEKSWKIMLASLLIFRLHSSSSHTTCSFQNMNTTCNVRSPRPATRIPNPKLRWGKPRRFSGCSEQASRMPLWLPLILTAMPCWCKCQPPKVLPRMVGGNDGNEQLQIIHAYTHTTMCSKPRLVKRFANVGLLLAPQSAQAETGFLKAAIGVEALWTPGLDMSGHWIPFLLQLQKAMRGTKLCIAASCVANGRKDVTKHREPEQTKNKETNNKIK